MARNTVDWRLRTNVLVILLTIRACRVDAIDKNAITYNRTCVEKESILLQCTGKVTKEKTWTFNGALLFRNKIQFYNDSDSYTLGSDGGLLITNVTVSEEGRYICEKDHILEVEYYLTVEVVPSIRLTVNNQVSSDTVVIEHGSSIRSTCTAVGSRPAVGLTWLINNEWVDPRLILLNETSKNDDDSRTFNTITTLEFQPNFNQGTITCVVHSLRGTSSNNAPVYIVVFPSVQLFIDGHSGNGTTFLSEHKNVHCVCVTQGSRPPVNITWAVNNELVDPSLTHVNETSSFSGMNENFDKNSSFILRTDVKAGNITCIVHSLGKVRRYRRSFIVKGTLNILYLYYVIPGCCVLLLLLGLVIKTIWRTSRKRKLSIVETELERRNESTPYQFENLNESSLSTTPLYSKCRSSRVEGKLDVKNITWVTKLSAEDDIIYWKGKLNTTTEVSYIVARTLPDAANTSEWETFRELARWLAALKRHKNIVITFKVEISIVPYLIYQTYVGNETLRKFLVKKHKIQSCYNNREDEESVCKMLHKFVCEIADGMLFLAQEGYRHPGLSAQRVLLDQSGKCILFDIWPSALCPTRVSQIMKKTKPPTEWLPPETKELLQYSDKSDVWSFGTITWEIFSLGDSPVRQPSSEEEGYEVKQNVLDRPDLCPNRLYKLLVSTWNNSPESRPSFEEIQNVLTCLNTDSVPDDNCDTYEDTSSFYYQ